MLATRLREVTLNAIDPALAMLPARMTSPEALVVLLAIGLQESRFAHRWQVIDAKQPTKKGPARGFWQFELGTKASRGGCWGVYLHQASRFWLADLCERREVKFTPHAIWSAVESDDILAAGVARLLLFTDPKRLPSIGDPAAAWELYSRRTWRPGKPHRHTWDAYHAAAVNAVMEHLR
jgi:hypothetical protein